MHAARTPSVAIVTMLRAQSAALKATAASLDAIADAHEQASDTTPIPLTEAAASLKVSVRVLRDAARRGGFPIVHIGRKPAVLPSDLARWVATRTTAPRSASVANDTASAMSELDADEDAFRRSVERTRSA